MVLASRELEANGAMAILQDIGRPAQITIYIPV